MSLIEINSDVKLLVKELKRIASALEAYLMLEHGYREGPINPKELEGEEPDVSYSTDEETMKRELDIAMGRVKDVLAEDN